MQQLGVIFVGLGAYFDAFFHGYRAAAQRYLFPDARRRLYVVTDPDHARHPALQGDDLRVLCIDDPAVMKWPLATLLRFRFINALADDMRRHTSHLIFMDADCEPCRPIQPPELFPPEKPLFAVQHPWYVNQRGTFETNPRSRAYVDVDREDVSVYWQGCLWGGTTPAVLAMSAELDGRIQEDQQAGVAPVWDDESHLNRYLIDHKPQVLTLSPAYAVPYALHVDAPRRRRMGIPEARIIHREGQTGLRAHRGTSCAPTISPWP